jgi:raffinose/stachyose/melibiose transport system substrate-binding protein
MFRRGLLVLICALTALTALGTYKPAAAAITLTVSTNLVGEPVNVLQKLADKFTAANPDIKIDFSAPGADYEAQMKVKMAANDLPDVFSTHGWAKIRYGSFLLDLKDQPWVSRIVEPMKPIVTDESGKVYVLPLDSDVAGPVYNVDLFKQYGLDVPASWDDLMAACKTIISKSNGAVTPIHVGGADGWPLGHMLDLFSSSLLISSSKKAGPSLKDGSFDWSWYLPMAQGLKDLQTNGCLNKDANTAKYTDSANAIATGKAAMGIYGPFIVSDARKTNPKVNLGFFPVPAFAKGDPVTFIGGEKTTFGVWKDSPNKDAGLKFLAFLAQPENDLQVAQANQLSSALSDVKVDLGDLQPYYDKYKDVAYFPYFDRVYLPNGMFDAMDKGAQDLLAGGITPQQYVDNLKAEYVRLRAAMAATPAK